MTFFGTPADPEHYILRVGEGPHYWEHVLWVWVTTTLDKFIEYAEGANLNGVVDKIAIPFFINARRERPADPCRLRAPVLRPSRPQPEAGAAHPHR